jgi:hypothetical protein
MDTFLLEQKFIHLCETSPELHSLALDWAKMLAFTKHIFLSTTASLATSHKKLDIAVKAFGPDDARVPPYRTAVTVYAEVEQSARERARALHGEWVAWREMVYTAIRCSQSMEGRGR